MLDSSELSGFFADSASCRFDISSGWEPTPGCWAASFLTKLLFGETFLNSRLFYYVSSDTKLYWLVIEWNDSVIKGIFCGNCCGIAGNSSCWIITLHTFKSFTKYNHNQIDFVRALVQHTDASFCGSFSLFLCPRLHIDILTWYKLNNFQFIQF